MAPAGEMIDDSIPIVRPLDSGSGRAPTPQALRRDGTPGRFRSPLDALRRAAPPVQEEDRPAPRSAKYRSKRKQRRWNNDHLLGLGKAAGGGRPEEGAAAAPPPPPRVAWRSALADLAVTPALAEERARFLAEEGGAGAAAAAAAAAGRGTPALSAPGLTDEEAEELMYLRVERRLRAVGARAAEDAALRALAAALDAAVRFWIEWEEPLPSPLPPALFRALAGPLAPLRAGAPRRAAAAAAARGGGGGGAWLAFPLGKSPFHRLLLHACCQFYGLHAESVDGRYGRAVAVRPPTAPPANPRSAGARAAAARATFLGALLARAPAAAAAAAAGEEEEEEEGAPRPAVPFAAESGEEEESKAEGNAASESAMASSRAGQEKGGGGRRAAAQQEEVNDDEEKNDGEEDSDWVEIVLEDAVVH